MSQKQQQKDLAAAMARVKLAQKKDDDEDDEDEEEEDEDDEEEDDDEEEEEGPPLPKSVLRRVQGLKKLHDEYEKIVAAYKEERIALEKKYSALRQPLLDSRSQVVRGDQDFDETVFELAEGEVNEGSTSGIALPDFRHSHMFSPSFFKIVFQILKNTRL